MRSTNCIVSFVIGALVCGGTVSAGIITAEGNVTALTDIGQMTNVFGTADFDEGPSTGFVSPTAYSASGLTFHSDLLSSILPGVTASGSSLLPQYRVIQPASYFPTSIAGGGSSAGAYAHGIGAATFSVPVTQVGVTASNNGRQFLTAWDTQGTMLGQVQWDPRGSAAFVGLDTGGVAIGMIAYGNDNLFAGDTFDRFGDIAYTDTWVWNNNPVAAVPEPCSFAIFGAVGLLSCFRRRR